MYSYSDNNVDCTKSLVHSSENKRGLSEYRRSHYDKYLVVAEVDSKLVVDVFYHWNECYHHINSYPKDTLLAFKGFNHIEDMQLWLNQVNQRYSFLNDRDPSIDRLSKSLKEAYLTTGFRKRAAPKQAIYSTSELAQKMNAYKARLNIKLQVAKQDNHLRGYLIARYLQSIISIILALLLYYLWELMLE